MGTKSSPTISIIVPVYGVESYVDDCMRSLRAQDYDNFEILVVDDGSLDGSMERVRMHAALDSRIRIIEQQNSGLGGARNTGVKHASGEFAVFVDSDDFVATKFLTKLIEAQRCDDYDIVSGRHIKISKDCGFLAYETLISPLPDIIPPLSDSESVLGSYAFSVAWGRLFKRSLLLKDKLTFPVRLPHEDLFFTHKALRLYPHHHALSDYIYFWRQRPQSLGGTLTQSHIDTAKYLRLDTHDFLYRASGTAREYVLAARQNIHFINSLRKRAEQSDSALFSAFCEMLRDERPRILQDLQTLKCTKTEISYNDSALRELLSVDASTVT